MTIEIRLNEINGMREYRALYKGARTNWYFNAGNAVRMIMAMAPLL